MSVEVEHGPNHDFHLVDPSPWPVCGAASAGLAAFGLLVFMHSDILGTGLEDVVVSLGPVPFLPGAILLLMTCAMWWRDVTREATHEGHHTPIVQLGMRYGMALFIVSEVMFFAAFFWAFFNASLFPKELPHNVPGGVWPPEGIETFNAFDIPFLNTLILLMSGVTVTWAHHAMREDHHQGNAESARSDGFSWRHVYGSTGVRVCAFRLRIYRWHLCVNFLHGDRISRFSCDRRNNISRRMLVPRGQSPFRTGSSLWFRGGGLVLAFRRCGLAIPLHMHLLARQLANSRIYPGGLASAKEFGGANV